MTDKLTAITPRLTKLLLIVFDPAATDGERLNAMSLIQRDLKSAGADGHDLAEQLTKPPGVSQEKVLKACEKYYAIRRGKEIEQDHRRAMTVVAPPIRTVDDIADGLGDYDWLEIVQHCAANAGRIPRDKDREFVQDFYERMATGRCKAPSLGQAKYLKDLFVRYFGGRI